MRTVKKYFTILMCFLGLGAAGYVFVSYYSFIFAKHVEGQVYEITRVNQPNLVVGSAASGVLNPDLMHSYAVAIRNVTGEIFTASANDRQWAVVQKGICVNATFYPYPPWDLKKNGTYSGARMNRMFECPQEYKSLSPLPSGQPSGAQEQQTLEVPVGAEVNSQSNPPQ